MQDMMIKDMAVDMDADTFEKKQKARWVQGFKSGVRRERERLIKALRDPEFQEKLQAADNPWLELEELVNPRRK